MTGKKKIVLDLKKTILVLSLGFTECTIYFLLYISYYFYKPMQDSLHCTNVQMGLLLTIAGVISTITAIPGGWLADKINPKKLIITGLLTTSCGVFICSLFMNYKVYIAMWALMSVSSNLLYFSAANKSVRLIANPEEQGKAYGYFNSANSATYNGIAAIGAVFVVSAFGVLLGFKYFIILLAVINAISAIVIWKLLPSDISRSQKTVDTQESGDSKVSWKDVVLVLKRREVWLFSIILFCMYTIVQLNTYFTPYFSDVMHLSVASVGIIVVAVGPFSSILPAIMGTISDRFGATLRTMVAGASIVFVLILILLFSGTLSLVAAVALYVGVRLIINGTYGITWSVLEETGMDRKTTGTCIGIASVIGFSPDIFMWTMSGHWLDKYHNAGYTMIFTYDASVAFVAIVALLFLYSIAGKRKFQCQAIEIQHNQSGNII